MTMLYPNLYDNNEVCYKGSALYFRKYFASTPFFCVCVRACVACMCV